MDTDDFLNELLSDPVKAEVVEDKIQKQVDPVGSPLVGSALSELLELSEMVDSTMSDHDFDQCWMQCVGCRKCYFERRLPLQLPVNCESCDPWCLDPLQSGVLRFWCDGCNDYHEVWTERATSFDMAEHSWNGSMASPTFSPSIMINEKGSDYYDDRKPTCHSYVENGRIKYLEASSHHLAGTSIELRNMVSVGVC